MILLRPASRSTRLGSVRSGPPNGERTGFLGASPYFSIPCVEHNVDRFGDCRPPNAPSFASAAGWALGPPGKAPPDPAEPPEQTGSPETRSDGLVTYGEDRPRPGPRPSCVERAPARRSTWSV